jgi:hypothetical protein
MNARIFGNQIGVKRKPQEQCSKAIYGTSNLTLSEYEVIYAGGEVQTGDSIVCRHDCVDWLQIEKDSVGIISPEDILLLIPKT